MMAENAKRIADLYLSDQLQPKSVEMPSSAQAIVNVPVGELLKLTGPYRRSDGMDEGFVANVSVQQERLVFTNHFDRVTRLAAISSTQFCPSDSTSNVTFEFISSGSERATLTIKSGSSSEVRYEPITVATPTQQQLTAYVGSYYCEELLTTYFISMKNGRLFLRVNNRLTEALEATIADEFVPKSRPTTDEGRVFQFSEYDKDKATRLRVRLWRGDAVFRRLGHE